MGFLCLPELKEEAGHTGNYGLYDQIAALKWVKANIEVFGGNPDNITIMELGIQVNCGISLVH